MLKGYKTYLAALGLLGLAIYQATQGDFPAAIHSLTEAGVAAGLRNALG